MAKEQRNEWEYTGDTLLGIWNIYCSETQFSVLSHHPLLMTCRSKWKLLSPPPASATYFFDVSCLNLNVGRGQSDLSPPFQTPMSVIIYVWSNKVKNYLRCPGLKGEASAMAAKEVDNSGWKAARANTLKSTLACDLWGQVSGEQLSHCTVCLCACLPLPLMRICWVFDLHTALNDELTPKKICVNQPPLWSVCLRSVARWQSRSSGPAKPQETISWEGFSLLWTNGCDKKNHNFLWPRSCFRFCALSMCILPF